MTLDDPGERAAYVALALTPGIGPARLRVLVNACRSYSGALAAPFAFLCTIPGISRAAATAIGSTSRAAAQRLLADVEARGAHALTPFDAGFPAALAEIPDPPALLFAQGDLALLERPGVAVVGSRAPTGYGIAACRLVVETAVHAGLVVVSGMARGLDAAAHAHALDLGGTTIGVLGNGLGVVYPAANRMLYERVTRDGLLVTEFPPGERPQAHTFPRRNRLISALAQATVVVEAGETSGALITASAALDQGRDVLAVPGPITSAVSAGANRLIRDGATPYLEPADLLGFYSDLAAQAATAARPSVPAGPTLAPLPDDLDPDARRVADMLGVEPEHLDALAGRAELPLTTLLAALCRLEIAGAVVQRPGRLFARAAVGG